MEGNSQITEDQFKIWKKFWWSSKISSFKSPPNPDPVHHPQTIRSFAPQLFLNPIPRLGLRFRRSHLRFLVYCLSGWWVVFEGKNAKVCWILRWRGERWLRGRIWRSSCGSTRFGPSMSGRPCPSSPPPPISPLPGNHFDGEPISLVVNLLSALGFFDFRLFFNDREGDSVRCWILY